MDVVERLWLRRTNPYFYEKDEARSRLPDDIVVDPNDPNSLMAAARRDLGMKQPLGAVPEEDLLHAPEEDLIINEAGEVVQRPTGETSSDSETETDSSDESTSESDDGGTVARSIRSGLSKLSWLMGSLSKKIRPGEKSRAPLDPRNKYRHARRSSQRYERTALANNERRESLTALQAMDPDSRARVMAMHLKAKRRQEMKGLFNNYGDDVYANSTLIPRYNPVMRERKALAAERLRERAKAIRQRWERENLHFKAVAEDALQHDARRRHAAKYGATAGGGTGTGARTEDSSNEEKKGHESETAAGAGVRAGEGHSKEGTSAEPSLATFVRAFVCLAVVVLCDVWCVPLLSAPIMNAGLLLPRLRLMPSKGASLHRMGQRCGANKSNKWHCLPQLRSH